MTFAESRDAPSRPLADVLLQADTRAQLLAEAQKAHPLETCGALLGACDFDSWWRVRELLPLPNQATDAQREYFISGDQVLAAQRTAQASGLEIVGFYHSHPASGAEPSPTDLERAWPGYVYAIAGAASGTITFWTLDSERAAFRPLSAQP